MPLQMSSTFWGGVNYREQAEDLITRTHGFTQGAGWFQRPRIGTESPDAQNTDFHPQGIRKRLGSALYSDLTSVLVASETILGGFEMVDASDGSRVIVVVGAKSMYTNQSGSFVQIKDQASSAFTWAGEGADITKFSVVFGDGRVFICPNNANAIQIYRGGADLEYPLETDTGHTYEESGTGTARTIDGTWDDGAYIAAYLQNRLVYSTGNNLVVPSTYAMKASSGIWKKSEAPTATFATSRVRMLAVFVPWGGDEQDALIYVGHDKGLEVFTGFALPSDHSREISNAEPPLNHRAWFKCRNWLVYLTDRGNILGINGTRVIDLGARLKASDGTGPLDDINISQSETDAFGFYDGDRQQGYLALSTSTARVNDTIIVLDFKEGEPIPGQPQEEWEARVRLMPWKIKDPDNNDWFVDIFQIQGSVIGVTSAGKLYTLNSGNNDLDDIAIEWQHKTPIFSGGGQAATFIKQFFRNDMSTIPTGDYPLTVNVFLDRESDLTYSYSFNQAPDDAFILDQSQWDVDEMSGGGIVKDFERISRRAEAIQFQFVNENISETCIIATQTLGYDVGAQVR